jgi:ribosomal-protein-alanine N-acetyltransferase
VWIIFDELHINTLAVHPGLRRQGLASLLLRHVLEDAVRRGADKATLEVRRSNEGARKLYERFGFEVGGVRKEYYRQPVEDALILWRTSLRSPSEAPLTDPNTHS